LNKVEHDGVVVSDDHETEDNPGELVESFVLLAELHDLAAYFSVPKGTHVHESVGFGNPQQLQ